MRDDVTIYLIRHGETDWNAQSRYQGQADIPMNAVGRSQAQRNGEALRALSPKVADAHFVASPLGRARETMEIVRASLGLVPGAYELDDRLKELHYGHWQGVFASDLASFDARGADERSRDTFRWRPRGGESYADLMERAVDWLGGVTRDAVVAAHGGISRVLRGHLYGIEPSLIPELEVPQDRILVLRRAGMEWL
ncbi:phosphoglycerate mutase (2,3-diphosphoglycerate-dependent) [Hyphomicrobium sp. 1Nfss2.1]|uniref:histidine phosphatase family protein n=1 Tax=Hyphomicrobium sp. 1Nfss2.1 TaxID=3413936 RepID=UPI003C7BD7F7